jgi:hypothetical protein
MDPVCHRCGTALNSSDELFCPHCGAPQLRYEPSDEPASPFASSQQTTSGRSLEMVSWKAAIVSALIVAVFVAIPVALLSTIFDFSLLWIVGGGIATVSLYRRRVGIPPTGRMGWRIGGLLGVLTAFLSVAIYSIRSVIQRYAIYGNEPDPQVHSLAQQLATAAGQANHSNPQTAAAAAQLAHFWLSPDGAAAVVLTTAALFTLSTVLFAAAGGAIGARIASLGKRPQRSSQ